MTSQRSEAGARRVRGLVQGDESQVAVREGTARPRPRARRRLEYATVRRSIGAWLQSVAYLLSLLQTGHTGLAPLVTRVLQHQLLNTEIHRNADDAVQRLQSLLLIRRGLGRYPTEDMLEQPRADYLTQAQVVNSVEARLSLRVTLLLSDNEGVAPVTGHQLNAHFCTVTLPNARDALSSRTRAMLGKCERYIVQGGNATTSSSGGSVQSQTSAMSEAHSRDVTRMGLEGQ